MTVIQQCPSLYRKCLSTLLIVMLTSIGIGQGFHEGHRLVSACEHEGTPDHLLQDASGIETHESWDSCSFCLSGPLSAIATGPVLLGSVPRCACLCLAPPAIPPLPRPDAPPSTRAPPSRS